MKLFVLFIFSVCVSGTSRFFTRNEKKIPCILKSVDPSTAVDMLNEATEMHSECIASVFGQNGNRTLVQILQNGCGFNQKALCKNIESLFLNYALYSVNAVNALNYVKRTTIYPQFLDSLLTSKHFSFRELPQHVDISLIDPTSNYVPYSNIFEGLDLKRFSKVHISVIENLNPEFSKDEKYYISKKNIKSTLQSLETALILACLTNNLSMVSLILHKKVNPNAKNGAALRIAAALNHKILAELLKAKANYRLLGDSAFYTAIDAANKDSISLFNKEKYRKHKFLKEELQNMLSVKRNLKHHKFFTKSMKSLENKPKILKLLCGDRFVTMDSLYLPKGSSAKQVEICFNSAFKKYQIVTLSFLYKEYKESIPIEYRNEDFRTVFKDPGEYFENIAKFFLKDKKAEEYLELQLKLLLHYGRIDQLSNFLANLKDELPNPKQFFHIAAKYKDKTDILKGHFPQIEDSFILNSSIVACNKSLFNQFYEPASSNKDKEYLKYAIKFRCYPIFHQILFKTNLSFDLCELVQPAIQHGSLVTLDHINAQNIQKTFFNQATEALTHLNELNEFIREYLLLNNVRVFISPDRNSWVFNKYALISGSDSIIKDAQRSKRLLKQESSIEETGTKYRRVQAASDAALKVVVYIVESGINVKRADLSAPINPNNGEMQHIAHGNDMVSVILDNFEGSKENIEFVPVIKDVHVEKEALAYNGIIQDFQGRMKSELNYIGIVNLSYIRDFHAGITELVESLYHNGLIVVAAAGNESIDACRRSPSSSPFAITVGGYQMNENMENPTIHPNSNFGACVDIFAKQDYYFNNGQRKESGTSLAAPVLTRILAQAASMRLISDFESAKEFIKKKASIRNLTIPYLDPSTVPITLNESIFKENNSKDLVMEARKDEEIFHSN